MTAIKIIFIYGLFSVLTYFGLSLLINLNQGIDREFDEAFEDNSARMLALLVSSLFWPITIICIIINNIKEEFKNGRN